MKNSFESNRSEKLELKDMYSTTVNNQEDLRKCLASILVSLDEALGIIESRREEAIDRILEGEKERPQGCFGLYIKKVRGSEHNVQIFLQNVNAHGQKAQQEQMREAVVATGFTFE